MLARRPGWESIPPIRWLDHARPTFGKADELEWLRLGTPSRHQHVRLLLAASASSEPLTTVSADRGAVTLCEKLLATPAVRQGHPP